MVTRGGASPARKGARFEARVVRDQEHQGRTAMRVRQGGGEVVDVVAFQRMTNWVRVYFIQAKTTGAISSRERASLVSRAQDASARALLAYPASGGICYEELSSGD